MTRFTVSFIDAAGHGHRDVSWEEAARLPVEEFRPIREVRSQPRKGRKNVPVVGRFWFSQTGMLVPFESRLEMMNLLLLDFTVKVSAVVSQPFLLATAAASVRREHFPDFFVRLASGERRVYDVKRASQILRHDNWLKFEMTRIACAEAGWEYVLVSELPPVLERNLLFLDGYRTRLLDDPPYREQLLRLCRRRAHTLAELREAVGPPALVLPSIYRLLWNRELEADLEHSYIDGPLELRASSVELPTSYTDERRWIS